MPAVRATIRCSRPCGLYMRDAAQELRRGAIAVADALDALGTRHAAVALPGYTHMQQAMPSSVALWAQGFAAEIRDDAEGLELTQRRIGKNPLGSAAGYGTPNLAISREETRRRLGFAVTHEPVTAVQLSRGKAEAQLLFEITLLAQDLGRLAADLHALLHAGIRLRELAGRLHHRLVHHAAKAQSRCLRADARAAAPLRRRRSTRCSASRKS